MKHVLLFTHGGLSKGFKSALDVISSNTFQEITTISLMNEDSFEDITNQIDDFFSKVEKDDICIGCTDIPAGSTTKLLVPYLEKHENFYMVSGLNLGLLLEIMLGDPLDNPKDWLRNAIVSSRDTLLFLNDMLEKDNKGEEVNK